VLPAAAPTRPWVSDRCCVWQIATLVFALADGAIKEVAGDEAVFADWTLDAVGVWALEDVVEVGTCDELDDEELGVEEHPVTKEVVIAIRPATIGIEFFISPSILQRWEQLHHHDTRSTPERRTLRIHLFSLDISRELPAPSTVRSPVVESPLPVPEK